ncbi:thioredoxin domain-containing protein [Spirochaeta africana]|uniref:Highly conserved protein containing a thioredoxin domain n=1 Tax=Spirochaeta africana (strain ATCC 700263 / DSM 8902 / Z-7692) TaxID=889378 RepID=H9UHL9_SPIAZ|nr:DUF255 domain-containing protein [Spirochaeta africana]AFG37012.1 highly conserved protein containing a thioredoxin domain [Spirochaeta africana DSM 8902]
MDLQRNTLHQSSSRYLRQHAHHPVWWHEWTPEVLETAAAAEKLIFVSVGYSSCHWCHVMADTTFTDPQVAAELNTSFICIKVDREQRPDIDQYLMDFVIATTGSGGWPLHVILTPELKPFFSFSYAPAQSSESRRGLLEILTDAQGFYRRNAGRLSHFSVGWNHDSIAVESPDPMTSILSQFDPEHGGFGRGPKLPPYSTLLFLLFRQCYSPEEHAGHIITLTLDAMAQRGLHDHVHGGFFRYCSDRAWQIPHFEKPLIDQAMQLWVYSLAEQLFPERGYRTTALGILRCLEQEFRIGDCYGAALDADVHGVEGGGALWSAEQLASALPQHQRAAAHRVYSFVDPQLQIDRYHIVQHPGAQAHPLESTRAVVRQQLANSAARRPRPELDRTILADANCLTGIALATAARSLGMPQLLRRAVELFHALDRRLRQGQALYHSISHGIRSPQRFARDAAAFALLADTLYESSFDMKQHYTTALRVLDTFETGDSQWVESANADFFPLPAASFDQPYPSTMGLIDLVSARWHVRNQLHPAGEGFLPGLQQDFANIARIIGQGHFFTIYTTREISHITLPVNSMVLPGDAPQYCYEGVCHSGILSDTAS